MKIRSLVTEKLQKQNRLCIITIFKCIFRYYLIIHVFLAHTLHLYKYIHQIYDRYISKWPNHRETLPPAKALELVSGLSNKQILFNRTKRTHCTNLSPYSVHPSPPSRVSSLTEGVQWDWLGRSHQVRPRAGAWNGLAGNFFTICSVLVVFRDSYSNE